MQKGNLTTVYEKDDVKDIEIIKGHGPDGWTLGRLSLENGERIDFGVIHHHKNGRKPLTVHPHLEENIERFFNEWKERRALQQGTMSNISFDDFLAWISDQIDHMG